MMATVQRHLGWKRQLVQSQVFLHDVDLASQHSLLGQHIQIQSLTSVIESCVCIGYDPMVAFVPSEHNPGLPGTLWWDIVDAC